MVVLIVSVKMADSKVFREILESEVSMVLENAWESDTIKNSTPIKMLRRNF